MPIDKPNNVNRAALKAVNDPSAPARLKLGVNEDDRYAYVHCEFNEGSNEFNRQLANYEAMGYEVDPDYTGRKVRLRIPKELAQQLKQDGIDAALAKSKKRPSDKFANQLNGEGHVVTLNSVTNHVLTAEQIDGEIA